MRPAPSKPSFRGRRTRWWTCWMCSGRDRPWPASVLSGIWSRSIPSTAASRSAQQSDQPAEMPVTIRLFLYQFRSSMLSCHGNIAMI
ncbi:UNVERIFIED_CONTAM: hypothetical protein GTU68_004396 [Idotea baltica]|nr:hypothetical protein [Idotea baltica]